MTPPSPRGVPRLTPADILRLYYDTHGVGDERIIGFANRLATYYLSGTQPNLPRARLTELALPATAYGALRRAGYEWIDEIRDLKVDQLRLIRSIGEKNAILIKQALNTFYQT